MNEDAILSELKKMTTLLEIIAGKKPQKRKAYKSIKTKPPLPDKKLSEVQKFFLENKHMLVAEEMERKFGITNGYGPTTKMFLELKKKK